MASITIRAPTEDQIRQATQVALEAVALKAVSIIKLRTAQGTAAGGGSFPEYSKAYALKKASTGRSSGHVDLTLSGQLLGNLKAKDVRLDGARPVAVIGFEGMHRAEAFGKASKKQFVSSVKTHRSSGKRTLHRTDKHGAAPMVPMAAIVEGLSRKYDFFAVRGSEEIGALVEVFKETFRTELRRLRSA